MHRVIGHTLEVSRVVARDVLNNQIIAFVDYCVIAIEVSNFFVIGRRSLTKEPTDFRLGRAVNVTVQSQRVAFSNRLGIYGRFFFYYFRRNFNFSRKVLQLEI